MDKETLIRLAQPAATALLALSIITLPITVKAYGESVRVSGSVSIDGMVDIFCGLNSCN